MRRFTTPLKRAGWVELGRGLTLFWSLNWEALKIWGYVGKDPFAPYEWRLYLGPVCLAKVTDAEPRRLSRQERRALERRFRKAVKK